MGARANAALPVGSNTTNVRKSRDGRPTGCTAVATWADPAMSLGRRRLLLGSRVRSSGDAEVGARTVASRTLGRAREHRCLYPRHSRRRLCDIAVVARADAAMPLEQFNMLGGGTGWSSRGEQPPSPADLVVTSTQPSVFTETLPFLLNSPSPSGLQVLRWLRTQTPPCPWDARSCIELARRAGHTETVKWALEQLPGAMARFGI